MANENSEDVRRTIAEFDIKLVTDMREYETYRVDKIRDEHIAYARSGCDKIAEGRSLDWIVEQLILDAPFTGSDIKLVVEFMNYFLAEQGLPIRFDENCNVFVEGTEVIHVSAGEYFAATKAIYDADQNTYAKVLADKAGEILLNHNTLKVLPIIMGDIVADNLDTALVARHLNLYLAQHGSELAFDKYLVKI